MPGREAGIMVSLPRSTSRRTRLSVLLGAGCAAALLAVLALQLHDLRPAQLFAHPGWLALAGVATGASLLAAMHNLAAFTPRRLRPADTLRAQLAVCGLRIVAPSALSTPAICTRYLNRCGLGVAESLAVVGTAQGAQFVMTVVVVAAFAALGARELPLPDPGQVGWYAALGVLGVGVIGCAAWFVPPSRRAVRAAGRALADVVAHVRAHPLTALGGLGASAALTLAHVSAFACCVAAAGGHASLLTLTAVYLAAASAGSLIPTPGGVGAVEAAMIAGLAAAGVDAGTATAAAVLTRLITVWALVLPGCLAARSLRRRGLL
jgi:uncharacterized membrane protein YbhN (UPF0104 family)